MSPQHIGPELASKLFVLVAPPLQIGFHRNSEIISTFISGCEKQRCCVKLGTNIILQSEDQTVNRRDKKKNTFWTGGGLKSYNCVCDSLCASTSQCDRETDSYRTLCHPAVIITTQWSTRCAQMEPKAKWSCFKDCEVTLAHTNKPWYTSHIHTAVCWSPGELLQRNSQYKAPQGYMAHDPNVFWPLIWSPQLLQIILWT